nr:metalloregulator ArsR/SmtB family transcription factor [Marinicella sp. W31]MDC2878982.1 metalloregulator ArsR/SmtB family transcription factor [Marinicella sp. W31]
MRVRNSHAGFVRSDIRTEPARRAALALSWNDREHCVCELMTPLGATQSRMSRHLKVLRDAELILDRRDAQWVRYRKNPDINPEFASVTWWLAYGQLIDFSERATTLFPVDRQSHTGEAIAFFF